MRRAVFFLHSWIGLIAGLGLLAIGVTGSAVVFKAEIDDVLNPHLMKLSGPPGPRLGADAFIATIRQQFPGHEVTSWVIDRRPGRPDSVVLMKHGAGESISFRVDPATAKPLGHPSEWEPTLAETLVEFHLSFLGGITGEWVVAILAVLLCLLGISGVYLYRGFWKTLFLLRWRKAGRIFFSDLHKMVGITSVPFNLILGFTGAWWNFAKVIGHATEVAPAPITVTAPGWSPSLSVASLMAQAQDSVPGILLHTLYFPTDADPNPLIGMWGRRAEDGFLRSNYTARVDFHPQTGAITEVFDVRKADLGYQMLDGFTPLHFGTFGGLPIKILWTLGGLSPGILAVTGSIMWWKRGRPRRKAVPAQYIAAIEPTLINS